MFLLLIGSFVFAEEPDTSELKVIYKEKTEIDFEGIEIEGQILKPHGVLVLERQNVAFNPLIKLRTDFNIEIKMSVEEMK